MRFWKRIVRNNCSDSELFTSEMAAVGDASICKRSRVKVRDWAPTCADVTCKSSLDPDKPVYFSQAPAHTHAQRRARRCVASRRSRTTIKLPPTGGRKAIHPNSAAACFAISRAAWGPCLAGGIS